MKEKVYHVVHTTTEMDGQERKIVVVGIFKQKKESELNKKYVAIKFANGKEDSDAELTFTTKKVVRTFTIGYSICHPSDVAEFNEEVGLSIALSRAKRYPIGTITSTDVTMLNEDACMALLENEAKHIATHLDKYTNL